MPEELPEPYVPTCVNHLDRDAVDYFRGYRVCGDCLLQGSLPWWMREALPDA